MACLSLALAAFLPPLFVLQFVHMMVDSDPVANATCAYTGKRLSLDLAAAEQRAPSPAPAAAGKAAS